METLESWVSAAAIRASEVRADLLETRFDVPKGPAEAHALASALNSMLGLIEEDVSRVRRFAADAAHEMRAPLGAMRTVAELGLAKTDPNEWRRTIENLLEETDRLRDLVDRLLSLSRAEAGRAHIDPKPCDLAGLARATVAQLTVLSTARKQSLVFEDSAPLPAIVDSSVIGFALMNLIDNAIKYCPEGAKIRVRAYRDGENNVVEVADNGPGIGPKHHRRVFERFYRVDRDASDGTGLGLSITKWAVEAHSGRVELQSDPGLGATFRMVLPAGRIQT